MTCARSLRRSSKWSAMAFSAVWMESKRMLNRLRMVSRRVVRRGKRGKKGNHKADKRASNHNHKLVRNLNRAREVNLDNRVSKGNLVRKGIATLRLSR